MAGCGWSKSDPEFTYDNAEASICLFAKEVLPVLKGWRSKAASARADE